MKKLIQDGKVAVIISPRYGRGWSTSNTRAEDLAFDPDIAKMIIENVPKKEIGLKAREKYPDAYLGGIDTAVVEWVNLGERFYIDEYDGYETIVFITPDYGYTA